MFVMDMDHEKYDSSLKTVNNASYTINCLAPQAKVIHDNSGIVEGLVITVHTITATKKTVDSPSGICGVMAQNIIPESTGIVKAVGKKMVKQASKDPPKDISGYNEDQVVSCNFNDTYASIFDARVGSTLNVNFVNVISWYDNEYSYNNRSVDFMAYMTSKE
ncbi:hypothetical protein A6R68_23918 [Neotoma lepida]|uniref:glyceraldehyde-3-phosphate dehydrogenase (phosphorylating) n=1 Tax=Neotoma lepida TaxID=56216 RepID=A0A1A6GMH7_NEOLE|nr:hypothetical protein A6R68_03971 [Neotoma lepida]OBS82094.1 hypothetical protein A6R68_23918 [Neotoma lepida]